MICRRLALAIVLLRIGVLSAEPILKKSDLFEAGTGGYALYRIPGIVVTPKGTVLAYAEARKTARGWGTIDIVLRRSTDEGSTYSPPVRIANVSGPKSKNPVALAQNLASADEVTYNNPVAIVDHRTGAIHFLFCLEYMRAFYMRSDDDGQTFSQPVEITTAFKAFHPEYDWKVLATGPGHGIQLKSGRLVVPVWLSTGTGGHAHRPSVVSTIFSDDGGKTWERGEIAIPNTEEWGNPSETIILQLADGRVMLNARSESKAHRRLVLFSENGATGWTRPRFHDQLLEPICMASSVRLSEKESANRNRILFANPDNLNRKDGKEEPGKNRDRRNLSVKMSYDEGETWPVSRVLEPGWSGYSDLATGPDGTIYCLYERGGLDDNHFRPAFLTLARFNVEWLSNGKDKYPKDK